MSVDITQIGSVYNSLETKIKTTLDEQWNSGRLTGSDYAQVLSNTLVQAMQLSVQSVQNQPSIDARIALTNVQKDNAIKQGLQLAEQLKLAQDTHVSKVELSQNQANKVLSDKELVNAQKNGITQQVIDNRKIKVLSSLSETYGTFGAGGLTMSSDMWKTYFDIASNLSGIAGPTSTTVSKVS